MAKTRSGLGRGLNSLLGGVPDEAISQEQAVPAERMSVSAIERAQETPAAQEEVPSEQPLQQNPSVQQQPPVQQKPPTGNEGEIYSNKEDNVTIKGVIERVVQPPAQAPDAPAPKQQAPVSKEIEREVDIHLVEPNPDQPRTSFKKEDLEELASSIKKNGLLQPILVREKDGKYQIIAGERRWQACKSLGMKKVPILVRDANDDETIILALVENIQRSDLNPIEEAYGYRRMMERGKMTQSEVAQAVSKGRSTVANALRLLELPEDAQKLLFEEKITAGHARAILSIPTKEGRRKLTDKLVEETLSVREAEAIARLLAGKKKEQGAQKPQQPKSYKTVARVLREALDTNVKIKSSGGKNKIEIEFKDETDLERLFRVLTANM